ncbi:transcriptional regulator [Moritella marina]|uniref:winged helix-turn-helix domain-containing protein n=1 Tax=Moritella marina TaxID=90736 RepID=UPI0037048DB3
MAYKVSTDVIFCKVKAALQSSDGTQKLSASETEIMDLLCRKNGTVVSKEALKLIGWPGLEVTDQSLTQAIYSLRKKLTLCGSDDVIATVFNQGYIVKDVAVLSADTLSLRPTLFCKLKVYKLKTYNLKKSNILPFFICLLLPYIIHEQFIFGERFSESYTEELGYLSPKVSYIYNGHYLTFIANEDINKDRKAMIEMFVDKIPGKSKVFSFITNDKTYILACPLSNNAMMCDSTVSTVLELPANEENITAHQVNEWFLLQQGIKSELPLFTGVMMSSTSYMFVDEDLTITDKVRFIFDFNHQVESGFKQFKLKDKKYEGRYKGSVLYSKESDTKNTFVSRSGDFTFSFDHNLGTTALVMQNKTIDIIPFNRIMKEKCRKSVTEKRVIWKVEEWGNQSLWVSTSSNKMWLFEESPLY